ncbi:conserved hypothetical protein [Thermocrinis albus DSM 14484]|uniref:TMEM205-like domain-containing protein n=1 Tax=Thermocrinis albus (strain DSM 14484 / JCM 11386 / HI 11/12) TaxID=638303 RepID=D3SPI9_THEAH|nr:DUF4149 domain-containing protein [Thermocrinis albus]ADC89076.1 conserved hypothetical protein [Thermocrinis albus DSM 14484]
MEKMLVFLNSLYLGMASFFSFYVAPTLFKVLGKEQAGKVVEKVFPVYFGVGGLVALLSVLLGFRIGKFFVLLAILNLLLHILQEFYILPTANQLKQSNYEEFMRWHGISVSVNLAILVITLLMVVIILRKL